MTNPFNPPPEAVAFDYRLRGQTHIFASKGIRGLVHVGSHDYEKARKAAVDALAFHVEKTYGVERVNYAFNDQLTAYLL